MRSVIGIGLLASSMPVGGTMAWARTMGGLEIGAVAAAGSIAPASKAVAVSKNFMPQSLRSKPPREFVKHFRLRTDFRNRRVEAHLDYGASVIDASASRQINKP
jgi:hypothetical protein